MEAKPLDPDQFVVLLARHERRVRSFIASLVACRADLVDDVLQATSLVAWKKLETFSYLGDAPDEELVRWMCTVARFEVMNVSRKSRSPLLVNLDESTMSAIADCQLDNLDGLEDRFEALKGCIEKLPSRQRELLRLRYWQGLSINEMALRRGRQVNAIYTALSRIRKALEECINLSIRKEGLLS